LIASVNIVTINIIMNSDSLNNNNTMGNIIKVSGSGVFEKYVYIPHASIKARLKYCRIFEVLIVMNNIFFRIYKIIVSSNM
jgi:hypothetical protein